MSVLLMKNSCPCRGRPSKKVSDTLGEFSIGGTFVEIRPYSHFSHWSVGQKTLWNFLLWNEWNSNCFSKSFRNLPHMFWEADTKMKQLSVRKRGFPYVRTMWSSDPWGVWRLLLAHPGCFAAVSGQALSPRCPLLHLSPGPDVSWTAVCPGPSFPKMFQHHISGLCGNQLPNVQVWTVREGGMCAHIHLEVYVLQERRGSAC